MDRPGEYAVALRWVWSCDVMGVVLECNGCGLMEYFNVSGSMGVVSYLVMIV